MKHKRLFILAVLTIFISASVFVIYKNTYKEELNYVALGDSLAAGMNPYGVEDYGYTDYVRDYLQDKESLKSYINYAVSGYSISNVIDDINYNRSVIVENKEVNIKKALRESDLVTISIGANDLINGMNLSSVPSSFADKNTINEQIDNIIKDIEELLTLVKQYAKGDIIVIGYYNPLPYIDKYESAINEVISYSDLKYLKICSLKNIHYVKISDVIGTNNNYLPNPLDVHPNKQGYKEISKKVIEVINKEMLK